MNQDSKRGRKKALFSAAAVIVCMLAAGICYSCTGAALQEDTSVWQLGSETAQEELETCEEHKELGTENPVSDTLGEWEAEPAKKKRAKLGERSGTDGPEGSGVEDEEPEGSGFGCEGSEAPGPETSAVWVHVCGCVQAPGLYSLPEGSRVWNAIEAAGGFSETAAADWLNLAQPIEDGMKIEVPDLEKAKQREEQGLTAELTGTGGKGALSAGRERDPVSAAKVNLNTASLEELMTLKGIGRSRAEDIIHYREAFGRFQSIEDIMNVSGIKNAAFEKIKDSITV